MPNELVEDSLLNLIGMLGKIQKDLKVPPEKRLDICYVLDHILANRWTSPLFKRRFTHILTQWIKLLPKAQFMKYFRILVQSLQETQDYVLIYEHCNCIHEMVKELDYWLKKTDDKSTGSKFPSGCLFDEGGSAIDEDDQIKQSNSIERQIDYASLFSQVSQKLIPMMGQFKSPTTIWNMINYLCKLMEKNSHS